MDTIFLNSKNTKTSVPHRLLFNLADKINLKRSVKYVALSNLNICYTCKNIKKSFKNKKFKIPAPAWNEKLQLIDGSYSLSDIQDYFEYNIIKHETVTDNPLIRIYANKTENKITFRIKAGYYLEALTPETMELVAASSKRST